MGKPADLKRKPEAPRWPFDPMQPGDDEPVRPPEAAKRVPKQTGAGPGTTESKRSKT